MDHKITKLIRQFDSHHYTKFLKNQRVIIVGPDTSLIGQGLGPYIDQYDIIIRHNTVFEYLPFTKELKKDYGSRTDVLYLSPTCIKDYASKHNMQKFKDNKIKYLVYQNGNKENIYLTGEYCFPKQLESYKKNLTTTKMHYTHHPTILLTELLTEHPKNQQQPVVPRTGFISIFDVLIHQAKEIHIIGMSFYNGGGHAFRPDVKKELNPLANHKGVQKKCPHNSILELELMQELMTNYPHIQDLTGSLQPPTPEVLDHLVIPQAIDSDLQSDSPSQ